MSYSYSEELTVGDISKADTGMKAMWTDSDSQSVEIQQTGDEKRTTAPRSKLPLSSKLH